LKVPLTYNVLASFINAAGQKISITIPGTFGVPTQVPIANPYNANLVEIVTVSVDVPQLAFLSSNSGYQLKIHRDAKGLTGQCKEIPADIKVITYVPDDFDKPTGPQSRVEFGIETIGLEASHRGSLPQDFTLTMDSGGLNDFKVAAVPSCGTDRKANLVGAYKSVYKGIDLQLIARMDRMIEDLSFKKVDYAGGSGYTYVASDLMKELAITGLSNFDQLSFSITNIPNRLTACSSSGGVCNVAWRSNRSSDKSFQLVALKDDGSYSPISVSYQATDSDERLWNIHYGRNYSAQCDLLLSRI
jgi:hypothetical protein